MKKLVFLIMEAILAIPVFGYEIFVVETGEFVQTETIPTVKKAEIRESDQIIVTYTFDSLMVVRDSENPDIVCFQPEGFGLIHWDEHAMVPYKMDQYLLSYNEMVHSRASRLQVWSMAWNICHHTTTTRTLTRFLLSRLR